MVDDDDPVGDPFGFGELMGGQQDAEALVALGGDDVADDDPAFGVDARRGLVEEEHLGPPDEGQGQGEALLFPTRQAAPGSASGIAESDQVQEGIGVFGVFVVGGEQVEHLGWPEHRVDPALLQHHPDARDEGGVIATRIEPEDPDRAARQGPVALESFHRARLAGAVGAKKGEDLAPVGVERQAVDGQCAAVADDDVVALDRRGAVGCRPSGWVCGVGVVHGSPRYRCAEMIDIRLVRDDIDAVTAALARRGVDPGEVARLAELDVGARTAVGARDEVRAAVKALSKQVGEARRAGDVALAERLADDSRAAGDHERELNVVAEQAQEEVRQALLYLPNLPSAEAPDGAGEADNIVARSWPEAAPTYTDAQRVPHWEIGTELGLLDMERGAKLSGSMFPLYRGFGARLLRALSSFALDSHADEFEEIRPPTMVLTATMVSTGHLPKFEEEAYHLERDDLWAIPTAEVPLTSMWRGDVLDEADLPLKLTAGTACYRREAGAAGRDTRGLLRVHEFDKVELFAYSTPDQAPDLLESMVARAEAMLRALGLQYRVLDLCTADIGNSAARTFDLEVYSPGVDMWLEVSSVSWCTDYQARRANIRYRPTGGGTPAFVHTLNGSALAWARIWAAIVETGRQADGSVVLPEVLAPYLRGETVIPAKR